ncbi:MAG: hypothetical protein HZB29_06600 [Nitrospinae bacterium]|nr:hypothetical protein [Nitrospinota bacterium]
MLLYIVESAVPLLVGLLVWAIVVAYRKDGGKHRKVAMMHAIATWLSTVIVVTLVRAGFRMGEHAPAWIQDLHWNIIMWIPPLLLMLALSGLSRKKNIHLPIAAIYVVVWLAALTTGGMMFSMHKGWL